MSDSLHRFHSSYLWLWTHRAVQTCLLSPVCCECGYHSGQISSGSEGGISQSSKRGHSRMHSESSSSWQSWQSLTLNRSSLNLYRESCVASLTFASHSKATMQPRTVFLIWSQLSCLVKGLYLPWICFRGDRCQVHILLWATTLIGRLAQQSWACRRGLQHRQESQVHCRLSVCASRFRYQMWYRNHQVSHRWMKKPENFMM